jgi:hypothetical protein
MMQTVFYSTNRMVDSKNPLSFGFTPDKETHVGVAQVVIPDYHNIGINQPNESLYQWMFASTEDQVRITHISEWPEAVFWNFLNKVFTQVFVSWSIISCRYTNAQLNSKHSFIFMDLIIHSIVVFKGTTMFCATKF